MRVDRSFRAALPPGGMVAALVTALVAALAPRGARAQAVRVEVRDAETGRPVPQAVVRLTSPGDTARREGVTTAAGVRTVAAPAGTYRVEVRRIGQRPFAGPAVRVAASDTVAVTVRVPRAPVALAAVEVRGTDGGCAAPATPAVLALWEAARTALAASAEPGDGAILRTERVERTLTLGGRVTGERRSVLDDRGAPLRFASLSPEAVERDGFVVGALASGANFYGPDARVLLSDAFARTHCFAPARGTGAAAGWLGVRFAPAPGRTQAEVEGVIWLDSATAGPQRIEFTYRWGELPREARGVGGEVEFARLPTGAWLVRRWRIRTPEVNGRRDLYLTGYRETAGEAFTAATPPTPPPPPARLVRVTGVIYDSLVGAPLAGATVTREGAAAVAFTDADGRFAMDSVAAGPGRFVLSHPALDSAGLGDLPVRADVAPSAGGDGAVVRLATPSLATMRARACGPGADAGPGGLVFGALRDAVSGVALGGAAALVRWVVVDTVSPGARARPVLRAAEREAAADSLGTWAVCGVPVGEPIEVRIAAPATGDSAGGRTSLALGPRGVARLDLWAAPGAAARTGVVAGVVRDSAGRPQAGVLVRLADVADREARTDAAGRFRLDALPLGTGAVVARAVGYAPQSVPVALRPGAPAEVELTVRRVATLAGVTVRAYRTGPRGVLADFDRRRRLGFGYFADTAAMRRAGSVRTALTLVPFTTVLGSGAWAVFLPAQPSSLASVGRPGGNPGRCRAKVVVDGTPSTWELAATLAPDEVVAVEVYRRPAEVPAQYQDLNGECGSVLFWTERVR